MCPETRARRLPKRRRRSVLRPRARGCETAEGGVVPRPREQRNRRERVTLNAKITAQTERWRRTRATPPSFFKQLVHVRLDVDPRDLHSGVLLAVADLLAIALAAAVPYRHDLGPLHRADHVGGHGRAGDERRADLRLALAGDQQDAIERHALGVAVGGAVDLDRVAAGHLKLLAALFDDRVHVRRSPMRNSP